MSVNYFITENITFKFMGNYSRDCRKLILNSFCITLNMLHDGSNFFVLNYIFYDYSEITLKKRNIKTY